MHIEPGVVDGTKTVLAYGTATAAAAWSVKLVAEDLKARAAGSLALRAAIATLGVVTFFEVLPHVPVGISEVHVVLGTTLLLLLGPGAAAVGLAPGLAIQGPAFAPTDLPMYVVNVTTLLVPLIGIAALARRVIPADTAHVDPGYGEVLKLSAAHQGGVVAWVAFWAFFGQGVGIGTVQAVGRFGLAYLSVVLIEPIVDLGALAAAKGLRRLGGTGIFSRRLFHAA